MGRASDLSRPRANHAPSFPDLPPYQVPSTGLLSHVPLLLLPYAELARIDKPGFVINWTVHVIGILHAGILLQAPLPEMFYLALYLLPACEVLTCVNFAWNDSCDSHYDAKVARTRHRPLVRGAVALRTAVLFDCALAMILASFLLPLPRACKMYAVAMGLGCFIYPFSKRWTNYPQLVLGIVLPSGIFMGAAALGAPPLPYPSRLATVFDLGTWIHPHPNHALPIFTAYLTNVVWTLFFEIIYSFQDVKWDDGAGVGTITRFLNSRESAKALLLALATAQTVLHMLTGVLTNAHSGFWTFSVTATFATLILQIFHVCLDQEESCMFWFAAGSALTGLAMLIGYAGEYFTLSR